MRAFNSVVAGHMAATSPSNFILPWGSARLANVLGVRTKRRFASSCAISKRRTMGRELPVRSCFYKGESGHCCIH